MKTQEQIKSLLIQEYNKAGMSIEVDNFEIEVTMEICKIWAQQENKELITALKRIANNDIGCWSNEGGIDSCDTMQTIAIQALKTKSE